MASYNLSPIGNDSPFFLSTGVAASGYKLFTYTAGSTTKQNTYQDNAGNTANANPILLNSSGYPASGGSVVEIWLTAGVNYKFVLAPSTDSDPPASPVWTRDNIVGINDVASTVNEWTSGPAPIYISATSFSLVGDQTATFTVGRRLKSTNTGGTIYSTIVNSAFTSLTTVTVKNDSGVLDSGLSAVSYGILAANQPSSAQTTVSAQPVVMGRLTLTSGTPVTTSDVTAATSVYFSPYKGNAVDIWNTTISRWVRYTFSELTLAVPATTATMYDVFLQNNAGTLQLNAVAWTNDTTRATALTTQNGVYVKTGALDQLYLGSFRTTGVSGQTEDSIAKRFVWNYYNRVRKVMKVVEATASWAYSTATWRQANGAAANQLDFVIGVSEDVVDATVNVYVSTSGTVVNVNASIALDVTNTTSAQIVWNAQPNSSAGMTAGARYTAFIAVGRHFLAWVEQGAGAGTQTWYGTNGLGNELSGIIGTIYT